MPIARKRSRGYTLTLNNYNEEEYKNILSVAQLHSEKWIFGKEVGKEGTPHIQGYMYFKQPKDFKNVIKLFNNQRIHFENAKGNPKQNFDYCSKDGNYESYGYEESEDTKGYKGCPWINQEPPKPLPECEDMGYGKEEYDDCGDKCGYREITLPNGMKHWELHHEC